MRLHHILLIVAVALVPPIAAQQPPTNSAEFAAHANLSALARSDFQFVARHTEPAELRRNRLAFDSLLQVDSANYIAQRLFRLDSTSQLRRLTDVEFTAGLMSFWFGINPSFRTLATIVDVEIPGAVHRGDTAFVIYRWVYPRDSLQIRNFNVEILVRCGAEWCNRSAGNFDGLVRLLKEPMVPGRPSPPPVP